MYKCYKFDSNNKLDTVLYEIMSYEYSKNRIDDISKILKECCYYDEYFEDFVLDADALERVSFPNEKFHIFISHSHDDLNLARGLSVYLSKKCNVSCFVDSDYWLSCDKILKYIDNLYCKNTKTNTYSYEKRNLTTSHLHIMLNSAIAKMINSCECFIFIDTENSVQEYRSGDGTLSPWIMSEILLSKLLKKPLPKSRKRTAKEHFVEVHAMDSAINIVHMVDLSHMTRINSSTITKWIRDVGQAKGEKSLDILYSIIS